MATEQVVATRARQSNQTAWFLPREHGATAMLFTPIVCAAILSRTWHWTELATLTAAFAALAAKDPMVVLARQRFVWKQWHPETTAAIRWFTGWMLLLILSGLVLLAAWPFIATVCLGLGVAAFSVLAIAINVKNRQRSTLFQIASAIALTSSSLAMSLSATGGIAPWCWWLWPLLALQATAGILIVHARLDARIALRSTAVPRENYRRAAQLSVVALASAAVAAIAFHRSFIALALVIAALGYAYDLHRQRNAASLQLPLKSVGQQALALSSFYAILLIIGLW
ncbi:MAG TPA: YwiC-like family protein [Terracidiphilus sp.]|nr:YwiC-like family protein [Terracidiphilus sp.]